MAQDIARYATQDQLPRPGMSIGTQHQQVRVVIGRIIQQRVRMETVARQPSLALSLVLSQYCAHSRQCFVVWNKGYLS